MTRNSRRRIALLVIAACVLVALSARVAIGAAHRGSDPVTAETASFRVATPDTWPSWVPRIPGWGNDGDAISVPGNTCPRSHPKKIGSSSASSATRLDGGPIRRHSRYRSICTR
ncbi:MAG: hypothetical protein QOH72_2440 [Solirubrobacteraceae bacterium]|jgi:hypothetical protein|nr:hypothetical protein [Solirubrobacteraceae bacterium]